MHSPVGADAPTIAVDVTLVEATTSGVPGEKACTQLVVPSSSSSSFRLSSQCSLGAGSHFGYLIVQDASAASVNLMFAFSRTQNPQAIGFSVEGFAAGERSAQSQRVNGLKRVLPPAAIPFQTNCFVGSFGKPVDYFIPVRDSTGARIGTGIPGHPDAHRMHRYLDAAHEQQTASCSVADCGACAGRSDTLFVEMYMGERGRLHRTVFGN